MCGRKKKTKTPESRKFDPTIAAKATPADAAKSPVGTNDCTPNTEANANPINVKPVSGPIKPPLESKPEQPQAKTVPEAKTEVDKTIRQISRLHFMRDTKVSAVRKQDAKKNRKLMTKSNTLPPKSKFKVIPPSNEVVVKEDCVFRGTPLLAEQPNQFAAQLRQHRRPTGKTPRKKCTTPYTPKCFRRTKK